MNRESDSELDSDYELRSLPDCEELEYEKDIPLFGLYNIVSIINSKMKETRRDEYVGITLWYRDFFIGIKDIRQKQVMYAKHHCGDSSCLPSLCHSGVSESVNKIIEETHEIPHNFSLAFYVEDSDEDNDDDIGILNTYTLPIATNEY